MSLSRRHLLRRSAAGLGLVFVGDVGGLFGCASADAKAGYGPLQSDPVLALPKGFRYEIVARAGHTKLESGEPTPSDADGTGSFARAGGGAVLVTNHEINGDEPFHVPHVDGLVYDAKAGGGTTTLEVDGHGRRVAERVSLAGTYNNCAGGITPWDTWLSCEETEVTLGKPHGYVFEVDPLTPQTPRPIKAFGRFSHESVCIDPGSGRVYLTEDATAPNGLLYRWTPDAQIGPGALRRLRPDAGTLEALRAFDRRGKLVRDLSVAIKPGTTYDARWVTVPDREASDRSTRLQLADVTRSHKLEGMWWGDGGAYFTASYARTADGSAVPHDGQVWFHDPARRTITLKLRFAYTTTGSDVDGPDNISVSPFGGVIMAEDGYGAQHLVGATESGRVFFFARNEDSVSEFTGPNFSPDGKFLFANVQTPGTTFAIQGPFDRGR